MQRALPLIAVFVLTVLAVGSAAGLNTALGLAVAPDEAVAEVGPALAGDDRGATVAARAPRVKSERDYLDTILKRNIFDAEAIAAYNPAKSTAGGNGAGPLTDLKVVLLGTVVATPESFSSALIADDGRDAVAKGYGIGDALMDAEIVKIEAKSVTIKRGDGRVETLTMDNQGDAKPEPSSTTEEGDGDGGVEKIGENKYAVDRSLIDKYVGDIESISRMGRALLHRGPDGDFDGYRLSAIRRNTLADQLGIKNGDVVHSVNGQTLNSVQGAMSAYQGMMSDSNFTFEVTRRGQRMTLDYEVR